MNQPTINAAGLSVIKDPFNFSCIESVWIHASKSVFNRVWQYSAKVSFKNGNTEGEQHFEGATFAEVTMKVEAFIKELEHL